MNAIDADFRLYGNYLIEARGGRLASDAVNRDVALAATTSLHTMGRGLILR